MKNRPFSFALLTLVVLGLASAPVLPAPGALSSAANQAFLADNAQKAGVIIRPSGLQYRVLHSGFGKRVGPDDIVQLLYSRKLMDGAVFDGTSPGLPAVLSAANVIRGMQEALQLMHEGDHWQLVIPPNLAFGDRGWGT